MHAQTVKSNILLLLTAFIWGLAFVAQRMGMEYVGPFTFNGIRFVLGGVSLLPLIFLTRAASRADGRAGLRETLKGGVLLGGILFIAASLQQIGVIYTTAGKAGFITGLYVVIVPILGLLWHQTTTLGVWLGAMLAVVGMYLLSVTESLTLAHGDLLIVISAFFWAIHVQMIGWLTRRIDVLQLSCSQFLTCGVLSLFTALATETITMSGIVKALLPIGYGGLFSVGIAYTLQVVAQRHAHPAHAAIILSLETVFAAVGGWFILGETLTVRGLYGCALMLIGMLISQLNVTSAHLRDVGNFLGATVSRSIRLVKGEPPLQQDDL